MSGMEQDVYRIADDLFREGPSWVTFFRLVLGVDGIIRQLYNTSERIAQFEQTPEYKKIQHMLASLRERDKVTTLDLANVATHPTAVSGNSLFVAWRPATPESAGWRPVGRLDFNGKYFRFFYTQGALKPGFQPFAQMEKLGTVYDSDELLPLFANRLLSHSRPEYEEYLQWSGFDPAHPPDPIVVLGVTEGIRQTDAIEVFPCPVPDAVGDYLNTFFLHGIRWLPPAALERIAKLSVDEPLQVMLDFQNNHDSQAVAVRTESDRMLIGYVPRYFARDVWQLVQQGATGSIELTIARVNPLAPLQNRVLCRLKAHWPEGFVPCSDDDFTPIPTNFYDYEVHIESAGRSK